MAFAAGGKLASAVSQSGGLGLIGGGYGDAEWLQEQFKLADSAKVGCGFITWSLAKNPCLLDLAISQNPAAIMLSFGDITHFSKAILDLKIKLIYQIQRIEEVQIALDHGVDIIVVQGSEAGGHGRSRALFPFVPEVVDLVSKLNSKTLVVAAGGIADGRGLAAALALGADGVLIGSRYWASSEALVHENFHKEALRSNGDQTIQTTTVDVVRGKQWPSYYPTRIIHNEFVRKWQGREELLKNNPEEYQRYETARMQGDTSVAGTFVGEAVGLISEILPVAQITSSIVKEAAQVISANKSKIS